MYICFIGDAHRQCTDIDECTRPGACGQDSICVNLPGSHRCECPAGTLPDPDPTIRCVSAEACHKDSDCPGNAICDDRQRCLCPEPNVGQDCRRKCCHINR